MKHSALFWLAGSLLATAAYADEKPPAGVEFSSTLFYEVLVGELSAVSGDLSSAYQVLLDAARRSEADALYERSVEVALRARAGDSALQAAQAWARARPGSDQAHRYLLQILVALNKLPDSVDANRRALSARSASARIQLIEQLPQHYARAADKPAALKALEQSLSGEISQGNSAAASWSAIGTLRLIFGDPAGALEAAQKAASFSPTAPQTARLALQLMDPELPAAEALLGKLLGNATHPELRMGYVRKLLETQRYQDASAQVVLLTRDAPEFPDAWLVLGSIELQNGKRDAAESALKRYVSLKTAENDSTNETDRGLVQAYLLLSQIAEQRQRPEEAQNYLDLINSPAEVLRVELRRAELLARQGKFDLARQRIRDVPELQAEDAREKLNAEARLLREFRRFEDEYALLSGALKESPDDAELLYDLSMAAEKLGKIEEMERLLRKVIAQKPDAPHAYNALGYSLANRNQRLDEARNLIQKALEFAPNDPYIADSLGWLEFRSGNLEKAEKILREAYASKQDAEIAAHLGEVLLALRQPAAAKAIWQEGQRLSPDNETLQETIQRLNGR